MHIVIVNRWPRFDDDPVRWDNELTRYEEFIDHHSHKVSYVVDTHGARGVAVEENLIAGYELIDDVNDEQALEQACHSIEHNHGKIDCLIALSEFTLEIAAKVRLKLDIPGPKPDQVKWYRDKVYMKDAIRNSGLRVPEFISADDPDLLNKVKDLSFPLILKPRAGAASIGVKKISSSEELVNSLSNINAAEYEIEEYIVGNIFHVDGYVNSLGDVVFQVVSEYVNDCLSFALGQPLGSYTIDDQQILLAVEAYTVKCCQALNLSASPFHLELFWCQGEIVFLEIGARVGGAEVPHLINKIHDVNLYECWLRELSGDSLPPIPTKSNTQGGWLVYPKPEDACYRVKSVNSLKDEIKAIWRELTPFPGDELSPGGSYDALHCGRFIYVGDSSEQIKNSILNTIECFNCVLEPANPLSA